MSQKKPVFMFSDSSLLFWQDGEMLFARQILNYIDSHSPKAAYIGASNGDIDEYYQLFTAAMSGIGVTNCMKIHSQPTPEEKAFVASADIILLAGGDVFAGIDAFEASGLDNIICNRYEKGAVLIGISAGAIQLGRAYIYKSDEEEYPIEMLNILPFSLDAHDEDRDWTNLKDLMLHLENRQKGLGLPKGGGVVVQPTGKITPIRYPAVKLVNHGMNLVMSTIPPDQIDIPVLH
ncbi:Type 1 glutamine amidotransferase-like domain-containing protein [Alteromonas sp. a30]|uniref:Type 1 glutamine amidotransferase-like domain-containing protein n=1 Tax=Alteromonas sp. a30 TaxID=2730917 RepID=UPI00227EC70C|nr:Type 1 glutamine amidotransferase-like domain-containing protein [Alteromonas sp. a30]MCY7293920.1 type 1 glutamine amidotransferase-like domain-containing protein [Alteromonas sp. a30]